MIDFNINNLIIEEDARIALHQYYNTNSIDENALDLYFKAIFLGIIKKDSNIKNKVLKSPKALLSLNGNFSIDCRINGTLQNIRICWKELDGIFTITTIHPL